MKVVIFDMDGTLIDSSNVIVNTINYVRVNLGLKKLEKDVILSAVNNPHINPAEFFYETKEFSPTQTKLFNEYYDKHCISDIKLYDGIEELLKNLSKKYTLTIATNAFSSFAKKMLIHLNISKYFSYIIGSDLVKKPKPNADMIQKTIEHFNIKKKYAILIGDSLKDYYAAKNSGVKVFLVDWGLSKLNINNLEVKIYKDTISLQKGIDEYFNSAR